MSHHNEPLRISISRSTLTNCGDHAERVRYDHAYIEGETVEAMVRRVIGPSIGSRFSAPDAADVIEVRLMIEPDGRVSGTPPPTTGDPFAQPF